MPANLEKSAVATGLEKVSFYFNLKERQCQIMLKLSHNCTHFTCQQSYTKNSSNLVSTVQEPRTSRFQLALEKEEEPEIKLSTFVALQKKQENSRKTSISALLTTPKLLTVRITTNYGKFFKRGEYQTTLPASSEICMQIMKQQLVPDMEQ